MEILPELHHVRLIGVDTFIIAEPGRPLTLIDAGMPWSPWPIERRIRAIGRRPEEIERIVCTHGHPADIAGLSAGLRPCAGPMTASRDADARKLWLKLATVSGSALAETLSESARAAWWMKDAESLRADLDKFAGTGSFGRAIEATLDALRGGLAALEERDGEAIGLFREARHMFRDLDLPTMTL